MAYLSERKTEFNVLIEMSQDFVKVIEDACIKLNEENCNKDACKKLNEDGSDKLPQ